MILSILIPTLPKREERLAKLVMNLNRQFKSLDFEIIISADVNKTTGEKRNWLIDQAKGLYTVFIDDDDNVPSYYIAEILKAAESGADCITFRGHMTTNGDPGTRVNFVLRMGERYEERDGVYYRWPNHITPIKRSIASQVKFPPIFHGEDYQWSKAINDMRLIKSEHFIDKEMYHYDFRTVK